MAVSAGARSGGRLLGLRRSLKGALLPVREQGHLFVSPLLQHLMMLPVSPAANLPDTSVDLLFSWALSDLGASVGRDCPGHAVSQHRSHMGPPPCPHPRETGTGPLWAQRGPKDLDTTALFGR